MAQTITQKYSANLSFNDLLQEIGLDGTQRAKLINDGFSNMKTLVSHYRTSGPKEFEKYIKDLNKTFATASTQALRVYYNPGIINRLVGCLNYFRHAVLSLHTIPDMDLVTMDFATELGQLYTDQQVTADEDEDEMEPNLLTLKGGSNWIEYRDAFVLKLKAIVSNRGFSLVYLIDETPRQVTRANAAFIEADTLDLSNDEIFTTGAVHFGSAFKADNKKFWSILEANLVNTDPFNHIAEFSLRKDGRAAWNALKSHFEGDDYVQKLRNTAMDKLKNTFYRGDTKHFKFEDYLNVHVRAHKNLLDIQYNRGLGLDDATKIHHFKAGIQASADLETAITLARPYESQSFRAYTTFLGIEVDSKNMRKKQTAQPDRRVSKVHQDKKKIYAGKLNLGPVLHETVDGKRVESRSYSKEEFGALSKKQRTAVIKLNRERKRRAQQGGNDKKIAATGIGDLKKELTEDIVSVGEYIVSALENKPSSDANDDITAITTDTTTTKRKAVSGSVGDFIAEARKRRSQKKHE